MVGTFGKEGAPFGSIGAVETIELAPHAYRHAPNGVDPLGSYAQTFSYLQTFNAGIAVNDITVSGNSILGTVTSGIWSGSSIAISKGGTGATDAASARVNLGLAGVTFAESTASPNATVYVDSITAAGASTAVDLALRPKGSGALLADIPDDSQTKGVKRGAYATDWSRSRDNSQAVASGLASTISGGANNYAFSENSTIGGGNGNQVSALNSTIGGGFQNVASGIGSSVLGGNYNEASGIYSSTPGGREGKAELYGKFAYASGKERNKGDSQFGLIVCRGQLYGVSPVNLTSDGSSTFSATNHLVLPDNRAYRFTIDIVATAGATSGSYLLGSNGAYWSITGAIRRHSGVATTAIIGTPTVLATAVDSAFAALSFTVLAEATTFGSLQIVATGLALTYIRWVATITTTEVS